MYKAAEDGGERALLTHDTYFALPHFLPWPTSTLEAGTWYVVTISYGGAHTRSVLRETHVYAYKNIYVHT